MGVLVYDGRGAQLQRNLQDACGAQLFPVDFHRVATLPLFRQALLAREPGADTVILAVSSVSELRELVDFQDLLADLRVILLLPDWEEKTLKLAHRLCPRFVAQPDTSLDDLVAVLAKMRTQKRLVVRRHGAEDAGRQRQRISEN
jgi:hypothetical protein